MTETVSPSDLLLGVRWECGCTVTVGQFSQALADAQDFWFGDEGQAVGDRRARRRKRLIRADARIFFQSRICPACIERTCDF